MSESAFVVVVPVKPPGVGKSRLSEVPDAHRRDLAEAFARDTVASALATESVAEVLAVTDDHRFASSLAAQGCSVLPDGVSGDLNGSLVLAAAECARRWPALRPVVICADLPALRSEDLAAVLASVPPGPAFLADAEGTGTTLYTARVDDFAPRFGPGSAAAHRTDGATELTSGAPGLTQDVDDLDDLGQAVAAGVGPHTARVLADRFLPEPDA